MSSYREDKKIFQTLGKLWDLDEELNASLLPIEKKKRLEKEQEKLITEYHHLLIELDRIEIRHSPEEKPLINMLRYILKNDCDLSEIWDYYYQYILDIYTDDGELIDRGKFLRNYFNLKPPYVKIGTKIPKGIKNIYHESRWCFVYGQYSAAIALSRTVLETVLKHKYNLEGKLYDIIDLAHKRKLISEKAAWNANKVRILANKILHKANVATEKQAKNSLDHILDFIEEVYLD